MYCLCASVWRRSSDCHGNKSSLFSYTSLCYDIIFTIWILFLARNGIVWFSCFEHHLRWRLSSWQKYFEYGTETAPIVIILGIFRLDTSASIHSCWRIKKSLCTLFQSFLYYFLQCWTDEKKQHFKKTTLTRDINKAKKNFWHFCKECSSVFFILSFFFFCSCLCFVFFFYDGNCVSSWPRML